jgi:hypothetical protein
VSFVLECWRTPRHPCLTGKRPPASNVGVTRLLSHSSSNRCLSKCFDFFPFKEQPATEPFISRSRLRHWLAPPLGTHLRGGVLSLYLN